MYGTSLKRDIRPIDFGISRTLHDCTRKCPVWYAKSNCWRSSALYRVAFGDHTPDPTSLFFNSTGLLPFSEFIRIFSLNQLTVCTP